MFTQAGRRALGAVALLLSTLAATGIAAPPAGAAVRDVSTFACPPGLTTPFTDIAGTTHEQAIACAVHYDVTGGTSASTFTPNGTVTRGQMAAFIARLLFGGEVPTDVPPAGFADTPGTPHAATIDLVVELGIAQGTSATTFSPNDPVTRAQMATFLLRTLELVGFVPTGAPADAFADDEGSHHEPAIDEIAALGIAGGTAGGGFDPAGAVSRGAMTAFLVRTIDYGIEYGLFSGYVTSVSYAALTGAAEVPGPGDPDGVGTAGVATTDVPGVVCFFVDVDFIGTPTAAHIHEGDAATDGPAVITLPLAGDGGPVCLSDPGADQLAANPEAYYVNLHTAEYPEGAVRGQLGQEQDVLIAELTANEVVPGPGDADGIGIALGLTTTQPDVLCMSILVSTADPITGIGVHQAPLHQDGPEVLAFGPFDELGIEFQCRETAVAEEIVANPAGYYVEVTTTGYPDGALRGQFAGFDDVDRVPFTRAYALGSGQNDARSRMRLNR